VQRIENSPDGSGISLRKLVQLALVLECRSLLEVIDDDWMSFQTDGVDVSLSPPACTTLERSAGDKLPHPGRERARGARGAKAS
jgi:hypothetical protein